jgi:acetyltransferase-like isoleucine patch superfamily enzyme
MGFLTQEQIDLIGFKSIGTNVLISEKTSIYNPQNISIGSNVRIDDYSILSAGTKGIEIGSYIHIACYVSLIGSELIKLYDFIGISSRTAVYSSSDDYSGNFLTGPTIDGRFRSVDSRPVIFHSHSIIGVGSVILPGVEIGEGTAVGALSLVSKNLDSWSIYSGAPARFMKQRSKKMLGFVDKLNI